MAIANIILPSQEIYPLRIGLINSFFEPDRIGCMEQFLPDR